MTPNSGFIDIHSHFLYGLDDGARTLEHSIQILELAIEAGTSDIVATPHADSEYEFKPEVVRERTSELQLAMGDRIRLHSGCDFHLSYTNVEDALRNPAKYTINGNGYLLVELSDIAIFRSTAVDFERLQKAGMKVIVTHPERNPLLRQRMDELSVWVQSGCYLQVTGDSLLGRFGRHAEEFARLLLDRDMVHFIASDAHGARDRTPDLRRAFHFVQKKYGAERSARLFIDNPRSALGGSVLPAPETGEDAPERKTWFRRFLRR